MARANADEIVKNRGAIVTGCGGCGKSRILELVKKKFEDLNFIVETCAFTHVASANIDGKTILRQLHAIAKSKRRVFLIDEGSMVSIRLWGALQTLQFNGALFVVFWRLGWATPANTRQRRSQHMEDNA